MKRLFIYALAAILLASCDYELENPDVGMVEVTLSFDAAPVAKADSPLIPDVENLIYDVWILQYDKMGLLIDAGTSHARATNSGSLTASVTTNLAVGSDCTICVLANLDRDNSAATRTWPQTLTEFKTSVDVVDLSSDIEAANAGTLTDMPMFGYWEGEITVETNNIQVSLGRMFVRINLVINNDSASDMTVESISNVSKKCYAFPSILHDPLPDGSYIDNLSVGATVTAGATKEMYFYMAPNFTEGETNATKLKIGDNTVILSNGAPGTANRDYNLYHNSNYTFTINVR